MTAFFFNRKNGMNAKFENIDQLNYGTEIINGRMTRIIYVHMNDKVVTLKQCEFEPILIHK